MVKVLKFEGEILPGEHWGIIGKNGSGKSALAAQLANEERAQLVSFEVEDALLEREIREDDTDFLDRIDPGRSVTEMLREVVGTGNQEEIERMLRQLGLDSLRDRGFRLLSTGEKRRVMIARALIQKPSRLVLDEPFDGLDQEFRSCFGQMLKELQAEVCLIIVANRLSDLDGLITHLVYLDSGACLLAGARELVEKNEVFQQLMAVKVSSVPVGEIDQKTQFDEPLVIMKKLTVVHGGRAIIDGLDWQIEPGQNWKITGPNGCGKSTLVNLITGDHPQCYSNDVTVMGMRRGSGESIWDVKRHVGIVSPALHQQYRVNINALSVVLSGFHDSIGLYQAATTSEQEAAQEWLRVMGMDAFAGRAFRSLSYGQQRLLLVARALVKGPPLLVLDEPCQGLDPINRALVLTVIDELVARGQSQLIYITHEPEDRLKCVTHSLSHDGKVWRF